MHLFRFKSQYRSLAFGRITSHKIAAVLHGCLIHPKAIDGDLLDRRPAWLQWIVLLAGAVSVIMLGIYGSGSEGVNFVYMGF